MIDIIEQIDLNCLIWVNQNLHCLILDGFFSFITFLGNGGLIWLVIGLGLLYRKETRYLGVMAILALFLATILGEGILKHLFMRPRPFVEYDLFKIIIKAPSGYSFPSGHTTTSFAFATVYYLLGKRYKSFIGLTAIGISISRVYLLVHYPTDIIAGIILGIFTGILMVKIGEWVGIKKWQFFKI